MGSNLVPKEDERPWVPGWVGRRLGGGGAPCILHPRYSGFYALSSQLLSLISLPGNLKKQRRQRYRKGCFICKFNLSFMQMVFAVSGSLEKLRRELLIYA